MKSNDNYHYQLSITYFSFRIFLAIILTALSIADSHYQISGNYQTTTFLLTSTSYFIVAIAMLVFTAISTTAATDKSIFFSIICDICFCFALMHLGGGFNTGLGTLLISPVAMAGIFFYGAIAFSVAAAGSILILLDTLYNTTIDPQNFKYLVPAGLLGALFFITSLVTQQIAKYIRKTETLVSESISTLTDLNKLNQFIVQRMLTGIIVINSEKKIQTINAIANQLLHQPLKIGDTLSSEISNYYKQWQTNTHYNQPIFQDAPGLPTIKVSFSKLDSDSNLDIIFIENQSDLTQQAQHLKLASLGRLSASIAHEIRNPLSAINHSTQLLLESEKIIGSEKRLLEIIENNAKRLNNIVSNVLNISKKGISKPQHIFLKPLLHKIQKQIEDQLNQSISMVIHVEDGFQVVFDESQLNQVLINLIDNAITYSHLNNMGYWVEIKSWLMNDIPHLSVIDKGKGVPAENIDKIFEPFFTTHPKGTGLGLYISKDLCEMNQALLNYITDHNNTHYFHIRFAHLQKRIINTIG